MFGGMGKNVWRVQVSFFEIYKYTSEKCPKSVPEPSVSHY